MITSCFDNLNSDMTHHWRDHSYFNDKENVSLLRRQLFSLILDFASINIIVGLKLYYMIYSDQLIFSCMKILEESTILWVDLDISFTFLMSNKKIIFKKREKQWQKKRKTMTKEKKKKKEKRKKKKEKRKQKKEKRKKKKRKKKKKKEKRRKKKKKNYPSKSHTVPSTLGPKHTRVFSIRSKLRVCRRACTAVRSSPSPPLPDHSPTRLLWPSSGRTPVGQSGDGPKPPTTAEGAHHAHNSIRAHLWHTHPAGRSDAPRRRILKRAAPNLHPHLVVHKVFG